MVMPKRQPSKITKRPPSPSPTKSIKRTKPPHSVLEVFDVPIEDLIPDEDNPNAMDEATFDMLVEEIDKNGFDEPIQIRPHPLEKGKWQISSGHHRTKAASVLNMRTVPAIIKEYDDREQKVSLVKRNVLRGEMDKQRLVKLYQEVSRGRDPATVQRELGFSNPKKIEPFIEAASKNMTPKQKKQLADAKEDIKTMDDLSSVLNRIFKESGSEVDEGYVCFSFGGKEHHYVKIDKATNDKIKKLKKACDDRDVHFKDFLQSTIAAIELPSSAISGKKKLSTRKRTK